jgi:hypothetical protein
MEVPFLPLPRWDCRNEADRERLIESTLARLSELDEVLPADFDFELEEQREQIMLREGPQFLHRAMKRDKVISAAKRKDLPALMRLVKDDPELERLAEQWLAWRQLQI